MKKKSITITPYTILVLMSKPGQGKMYWFSKEIEPVIKPHGEAWQFFTQESQTIKYNKTTKIYVIDYAEGSDPGFIFNFANEHHLNVVGINVGELIKESALFNNLHHITNSSCEIDFFYEIETSENFYYDGQKYCIVGDIHGSYETFIEMLNDNKGILVKNGKIFVTDESKKFKYILVGDYLDKGDYKGIKKTIEFIFNNIEHFIICKGNHEWWVAEYLSGKIKPSSTNTEIIGKWFQSVVLLLQDDELRKKFFYIYNRSYHSVETDLAIITHSPCENKYLLKSDSISLKKQRNLQYPKDNIDFQFEDEKNILLERAKFFNFIKEEANDLDKYHLFGHTMIPEIYKFKNKICLDTGCVIGNKLSIAMFDNGELTLKSYENKNKVQTEKLIPYFVD